MQTMTKEHIIDKFFALMQDNRVSYQGMAKKLGVTKQYVWSVHKRKKNASPKIVKEMELHVLRLTVK